MFNLVNVVNAQAATKPFSTALSNPTVNSLVTKITDNIVSPIVVVLFTVAFLVFVWGMFEMISHAEDSKARETGQQAILWSVVGTVIMVSVYGIIRLIASSVGADDPFL